MGELRKSPAVVIHVPPKKKRLGMVSNVLMVYRGFGHKKSIRDHYIPLETIKDTSETIRVPLETIRMPLETSGAAKHVCSGRTHHPEAP